MGTSSSSGWFFLTSYYFIRHEQTFEQHASQITYFINQCRQTDPEKVVAIREGLALYVIGQCCPKMWRRINPNTKFHLPSRPQYFRQIVGISAHSLFYFPCNSFNKFNTAFLRTLHSYRGQCVCGYITNDLAIRMASCDDDDEKSQVLDEILWRGKKTADHLFQNLLKLDPNTPQSIYMRKTYREFHELLCLLLLGYRDSVKRLYLMKKDKTTVPSPATLYANIITVCDYMSTLCPLAHSAVIIEHFQMLTIVLWNTTVNDSAIIDDYLSEDEKTEEEEILAEDLADDAESIEDNQVELSLVMGVRYRRWLQLQMTYLNAVSLIITLVEDMPGDKTAPITLTVIPVPHPSKDIIPWQEVIREVTHRSGLADDGVRAGSDIPSDALDAERVLEAMNTMMDRYPEFKGSITNFSAKGFKGRIHCEAFLASVMAEQRISTTNSVSISFIINGCVSFHYILCYRSLLYVW